MTTKIISGSYANGYTLAATFTGLSITSSGAVQSAPGTPASTYGGYGGNAGFALTLPKGGFLANSGKVQGGAGGVGGNASMYAAGYAGGGGGYGGAGVVLKGHGSVTNHGSIGGGAGGAGGAGSPGYYYSDGSVGPGGDGGNGSGGGTGIVLTAGGGLTNFGTISGGAGGAGGLPGNAYAYYGFGGGGGDGVALTKAGAVTNRGVIRGGSGGYGGGYAGAAGYYGPDGDGIRLINGGTVANGSASNHSALIEGQVGVFLKGAGKVTNFGTIWGVGGDAIVFGSAADELVVEAGSTFKGKVDGHDSAIDLASGTGVISAFAFGNLTVSGAVTTATTFKDFGTVEVGKAGAFTDSGAVKLLAGQSLTVEGSLALSGAVANAGTIRTSGGSLTVSGAVTGAGSVRIAGGLADFASGFNENVAFTAAGGELELGLSRTYGGKISGFSKTGATMLDLRDIAFVSGTTKATFAGTTAGGVLTVTEGTHTAKISLVGNYLASKFVVASDSHGGTLVHDPAAAAPQRFAAAMAAFAPAAGPAHAAAEGLRGAPPPALARPGALPA